MHPRHVQLASIHILGKWHLWHHYCIITHNLRTFLPMVGTVRRCPKSTQAACDRGTASFRPTKMPSLGHPKEQRSKLIQARDGWWVQWIFPTYLGYPGISWDDPFWWSHVFFGGCNGNHQLQVEMMFPLMTIWDFLVPGKLALAYWLGKQATSHVIPPYKHILKFLSVKENPVHRWPASQYHVGWCRAIFHGPSTLW